MKVTRVGIVAAMLVSPAFAQAPKAPDLPKADSKAPECQQLNINASYAISALSFEAVKNEFDQRLIKIENFVKNENVKKFKVVSLSYNIRSDGGGGGLPAALLQGSKSGQSSYSLTGTAEFQMDSSDPAFRLGQFMTQDKFEVTVTSKKIASCGKVETPAASAPAVPGAAGGSTMGELMRGANSGAGAAPAAPAAPAQAPAGDAAKQMQNILTR